MTGIDRRNGTPMGPPWPVDVVADLHAGVFDDAVTAALRPRMESDAEAAAILAALDATTGDLGALARLAPTPIPARFADRLDAAIAAESRARARPGNMAPLPPPAPAPSPTPTPVAPPAPVADLAAARRRRNRMLGWGGGALVAAAAVVGVVLLAVPTTTGGSPSGVALPPPVSTGGGNSGAGAPQALTKQQVANGAPLAAALGRTDYGTLSAPARRAACLAANGQDANRAPAGAMPVTLDGKTGELLVLTTGQTAQYRLLVVGPGCGAGNPDQLANAVIGGIPATH